MDSVDLDVLKRSAEWLEAGRRVLLVTVVMNLLTFPYQQLIPVIAKQWNCRKHY